MAGDKVRSIQSEMHALAEAELASVRAAAEEVVGALRDWICHDCGLALDFPPDDDFAPCQTCARARAALARWDGAKGGKP